MSLKRSYKSNNKGDKVKLPRLDENGNEFRDNNGEIELVELSELSNNDLELYKDSIIEGIAYENLVKELKARDRR